MIVSLSVTADQNGPFLRASQVSNTAVTVSALTWTARSLSGS
jgi:hypothetical protein